MDYYLLNTTPAEDPAYCILGQSPEGTEAVSFKLSDGDPMGAEYPATPAWRMSEDFPGLKVGSLVASLERILVVHKDVKDVLVATGVPMEVLPFVLVDHKKNVASRDHFVVNVLGTRDCLDLKRSDIVWSKKVPGRIVKVKKHVLDPGKLADAPELFRVKEDPPAIVMSAGLLARVKALNPTNFYLWKLDQGASA